MEERTTLQIILISMVQPQQQQKQIVIWLILKKIENIHTTLVQTACHRLRLARASANHEVSHGTQTTWIYLTTPPQSQRS